MSTVQQPGSETEVLEFALGGQEYCVTIDTVREIVNTTELTPMPETPPAVVGMIDLRGQPTVIVNPTRVFGTAEQTAGEQQDPETEPVEDNELVSGVVRRDGQFTLWVDPERVNEPFSMTA